MTELPLLLKAFTELVKNPGILTSFFFIFIFIITEPRQHGSVTAWELFVIVQEFYLVFSSNTSKLRRKWKENFVNHDKRCRFLMHMQNSKLGIC